jgi:chromosome segregation ATPase
MIEPIMFVGIGFLVAGLLVLGVIPLVHARAVRLTMKRLEAVTPMSMAEIQADKDQLRAEFAMSTRRLEMSVEQMKTKTTSQLAEIGKKSEGIGRLKLELGEKTAALLELEAREAKSNEELSHVQQQLAATANELAETEQVLAATQNEFAQLTANFNDSSMTADSQRVDLVALRAQVEVFKGQIESYEKDTTDLRSRLAGTSTDLQTATQELADERARIEPLMTHIEELERLLVAQTTEAEILGRRVQEQRVRLDEQDRFLAEHEYAADLLRNQAGAAQKTEADVRAALAEAEARRLQTTGALSAERAALEDQLRQSQEERRKLERELTTLKREAESTWATERMENAVLRERINDVAAEVARLTSALEGPSSPIDEILASDAARSQPAAHGATSGNGQTRFAAAGANSETSKGTLADRIRALQSRASRIAHPSGA